MNRMKFWSVIGFCMCLWGNISSSAQNQIIFPHPDRIKYDSHCLQIEGKDTFIYSGAFHYFRVPKELWGDRFRKMKEAGLNGVETYVPWNYHEPGMPDTPDDYSKMDLSDLEDWITMAESYGLYVIIRPGPYICAEWDGGGFPQWLVARKKPAGKKDEVWLQTADPDFLKWNKHWYDAVCRVVVPHQITKKPVGSPGVILFQIENEYERIHFIPKAEKKRYLEVLAEWVRKEGIEVPVFTCWTTESRNVKEGPLAGVFDFMNFYPKWDIKRRMANTYDQEKEQSYAPKMSAELQGGWYSEVGGQLSKDIDGISPVQIQNITLYALQLGFSLINYYMFVGGTNFDDWASRETTTTYDCAASIRENGGVDEKYRRITGISRMLKEQGTRLARSDRETVEAVVTDSMVEVFLRRAADGSRFFFVRTEDRWKPHSGNIRVKEADGTQFSFDYALEPFGSMIFYLPSGTTDAAQGKWYPQLPPPMVRPVHLPDPILLTQGEERIDPLPTRWIRLKPGQHVEDHGYYDRHFMYYRASVPAGKEFTVGRIGQNVMNRSTADGILAWAEGRMLSPVAEDKECVTFRMPAQGKEVILLFENRGLHHHTNLEVEKHWNNGIRYVKVDGKEVPLQFASVEKERGITYSSPGKYSSKGWSDSTFSREPDSVPGGLLTWNRFTFELPERQKGVWVPWKVRLDATGNGFIYLNGRCIGRTWEAGPQREFFLPECELNFGKGKTNVITVSLRPDRRGAKIRSVSVLPDADFAEERRGN